MKLRLFIFILILSFCAFVPMYSANAQVTSFGGFIAFNVYCTCSSNWLIYVTPPNSGFFSYTYTPQYAFYRLPYSGVWTLGNYTSGGTCKMYYGLSCGSFIEPTGIISQTVGTSL